MRPRAILVGPTPPPHHGGSIITRNLLSSPLTEWFDVVHVDTSDRRTLENLGYLDARNVVLAAMHGWRFVAALVRERPALAHVPVAQNRLGFLRDCLFLLPARLLGVPVIVHMNGGYCRFFVESGGLIRWLARQTLGRAHRVLVLGERLRPDLESLVGAERTTVVPYGVPDVHDHGRRRRDGPVRVLYLGTLTRTKGFLDVLAAAELTTDTAASVEFVLAGPFGSPADERLAAPYRERLGERVRFAGVVDGAEKTRLLLDSDIFVFPSYYRYEGQPLVVLEAMAAGLPVLSTDHGVIAETVADGETGYLVAPRDPSALAERILELAGDSGLRSRMGAAGRDRYLERYTVDVWAGRIADVWRDAAGVRRAREAAAA